ncbi:MAG: DUF5668 domain-containing protein [Bacillota bacterium]|nr:DUF5668 domain-containing protein [Bacillota bacterium]
MRQWRVGTLTMGLLLVFLGGALLFAQFNSVPVVDFFIRWWPLLFILLGIEVLLYSFMQKREESRIRYDIFSIFIILLIVISGLGIQSLNELDLTTRFREMVGSQNFTIQTDEASFSVAPDVKQIIVLAPPCDLTVKTAMSNKIVAQGTAHMAADTMSTAKELLKNNQEILCRQTDDTLFVSFNTCSKKNDLGYHWNLTSYALTLPKFILVKIQNDNYFTISVDADLSSDWQIDSEGRIDVNLPINNTLAVNAIVNDRSQLEGTVNWEILGPANPHANDEEELKPIQARVASEEPLNNLNIITQQSISVNQLQ